MIQPRPTDGKSHGSRKKNVQFRAEVTSATYRSWTDRLNANAGAKVGHVIAFSHVVPDEEICRVPQPSNSLINLFNNLFYPDKQILT